MGYRLAPEVRFPDSCDDVELGLRWLVEHVAERGGDPNRIYLSGHSAGAMLAAAVGFHLELIRGLVLISGFYDVSQHSDEIINRASPRYVARQMDAIERLPAHTILIVGDNDLPAALPSAETLQAAIRSRGGSVELFVEPNADHFTANRGFHTPGSPAAQAVSAMLGL
jgi:acetyl esterase/lipase